MTMIRSIIMAALLIGAVAAGLFPTGAASAPGFEQQDASEADERTRASMHLNYNVVIFDGDTAKEFVFSKVPDAADFHIPAPYDQDEIRSILLKCGGFQSDGSLDDCQIQAERELEPAGRQLVSGLAVDPAYLGSIADSVEEVLVAVRITTSDVPWADGPCLPPGCIPVSLTPRRNESVFVNYSTIFFQSGGWQQFEFSHLPDAAALNIPFRPEKFAMIGISCAGFTPDGRLDDCYVRVEPENAGYEDVGAELARELVVDRAFMRSLERPVERISIHARVSNSDVEADEGPCWSPGCIPVPLPPPPPPTERFIDPELEAWFDAWDVRWDAANEASTSSFRDARRAVSQVSAFAPESEKWRAARAAVRLFLDSREQIRELLNEFVRFRSEAYSKAVAADQIQMAEIINGHHDSLARTESNATKLLLALIR